MARYKMEDGTILDTSVAKQTWEEDTRHDGCNHISVNTNSQWHHETLYLSKKDRFYIVSSSNYRGVLDTAEYVEDGTAATWLLVNSHELPASLAEYAAEIVE